MIKTNTIQIELNSIKIKYKYIAKDKSEAHQRPKRSDLKTKNQLQLTTNNLQLKMCDHLEALENEIKSKGIKESFRGEAWSENCREWVYYNCYLDCESIRSRLKLPDFVKHSTNDDIRSGLEDGFYCSLCKDAIMGYHRKLDGAKKAITIK